MHKFLFIMPNSFFFLLQMLMRSFNSIFASPLLNVANDWILFFYVFERNRVFFIPLQIGLIGKSADCVTIYRVSYSKRHTQLRYWGYLVTMFGVLLREKLNHFSRFFVRTQTNNRKQNLSELDNWQLGWIMWYSHAPNCLLEISLLLVFSSYCSLTQ